MNNFSKYQVKPCESPGCGCFIVVVIILLFIVIISGGKIWAWSIFFWFSLITAIVIIKSMCSDSTEAKGQTESTRYLLKSSLQLERELPILVEQIGKVLQKAEYEYKSNAYGPFWDAVEEAAKNLNQFNQNLNTLSSNVQYYTTVLKGKKHNFPACCVQKDDFLMPENILYNFQRIVRMGQTNFEFATIWEHRKTREILILGFKTLGEAVDNLSSAVYHSISELNQSISESISQLTEEQIKTREDITEESRKIREAIRKPTTCTMH